MPRSPRYKATEEGSLLDTRTGKMIEVAEFEVVKSGRMPVVKITPVEGKKIKIARYMIDEAVFQFGPKDDTPPPAAAKRRGGPVESSGWLTYARRQRFPAHLPHQGGSYPAPQGHAGHLGPALHAAD
ncbi:MAG: hypothetical protein AB1428_13005 [Bacteroidota bacterium]